MGHIQLADPPTERAWRRVDELVSKGASAEAVAGAVAAAAEPELAGAVSQASLAEAIVLLAGLPQAAAAPDPLASLRAMKINVTGLSVSADLGFAIMNAVERAARSSGTPNDFDALVTRSLLSSLAQILESASTHGEISIEALRAAVAQRSNAVAFVQSAQLFFGDLLARTLASWLDRNLSGQVGPEHRFATAADRARFGRDLTRLVHRSATNLQDVSANWYEHSSAGADSTRRERASTFSRYAVLEITEDLRSLDEAHA